MPGATSRPPTTVMGQIMATFAIPNDNDKDKDSSSLAYWDVITDFNIPTEEDLMSTMDNLLQLTFVVVIIF